MKRNRWGLTALLWFCLLDCAGFGEGVATPASSNETGSNPAWMTGSRTGVSENEPIALKRSAWRSLGALLAVTGGLIAVHYYVRRRSGCRVASEGSRLKVVSRLPVGARQELLVVDWEGDRFIVGVGPLFIQPVHHQKKSDGEAVCE